MVFSLSVSVYRQIKIIFIFVVLRSEVGVDFTLHDHLIVKDYRFMTEPMPPYVDYHHKKLTNDLFGNPLSLQEGDWVGRFGSLDILFNFHKQTPLDFFSANIMDDPGAHVRPPLFVRVNCLIKNKIVDTREIPLTPRREGGSFEIGNKDPLRMQCESISLDFQNPDFWIFIGEVRFYNIQQSLVPKSLFLQLGYLNGYSDQEITSWFEKVCKIRKNFEKGRIYNLTLTDIAEVTGDDRLSLREDKLNLISKYFYCFDKIFIGLVGLQSLISDPFYSGILDRKIRMRNIHLTDLSMDLLLKKYPQFDFQFYLDYEANLNDFTNVELMGAHLEMNTELINHMQKRKPGVTIFWSPTFQTPFSQLSQAEIENLRFHLQYFFNTLNKNTLNGGIHWLAFQDCIGQSYWRSIPISYSDVHNYFHLLNSIFKFQKLEINMEYFAQISPHFDFISMPGFEIASRQSFYKANFLPLGMAWEMRWWFENEGQWIP